MWYLNYFHQFYPSEARNVAKSAAMIYAAIPIPTGNQPLELGGTEVNIFIPKPAKIEAIKNNILVKKPCIFAFTLFFPCFFGLWMAISSRCLVFCLYPNPSHYEAKQKLIQVCPVSIMGNMIAHTPWYVSFLYSILLIYGYISVMIYVSCQVEYAKILSAHYPLHSKSWWSGRTRACLRRHLRCLKHPHLFL